MARSPRTATAQAKCGGAAGRRVARRPRAPTRCSARARSSSTRGARSAAIDDLPRDPGARVPTIRRPSRDRDVPRRRAASSAPGRPCAAWTALWRVVTDWPDEAPAADALRTLLDDGRGRDPARARRPARRSCSPRSPRPSVADNLVWSLADLDRARARQPGRRARALRPDPGRLPGERPARRRALERARGCRARSAIRTARSTRLRGLLATREVAIGAGSYFSIWLDDAQLELGRVLRDDLHDLRRRGRRRFDRLPQDYPASILRDDALYELARHARAAPAMHAGACGAIADARRKLEPDSKYIARAQRSELCRDAGAAARRASTSATARASVLAASRSTLAPGAPLGLIGPAASGKSVSAKLVCGLEQPRPRRDRACSARTSSASARPSSGALRQRIGMLFQNYALFDFLTVAEQRRVPARAARRAVAPTRSPTRVADAAARGRARRQRAQADRRAVGRHEEAGRHRARDRRRRRARDLRRADRRTRSGDHAEDLRPARGRPGADRRDRARGVVRRRRRSRGSSTRSRSSTTAGSSTAARPRRSPTPPIRWSASSCAASSRARSSVIGWHGGDDRARDRDVGAGAMRDRRRRSAASSC